MSDTSNFGLLDMDSLTGAIKKLEKIGRAAWRQGLMAGFSGNISMRTESGLILITGAGVCKGRMTAGDFALVDIAGQVLAQGVPPSSESGLHLALYRACESCMSILHSHPSRLQALELLVARQGGDIGDNFLHLDLYEADVWRKKLVFASTGKPGASETAEAAVDALETILPCSLPCAIWLPRHGLCALAETPNHALGITEELEHLAGIQLICGQDI